MKLRELELIIISSVLDGLRCSPHTNPIIKYNEDQRRHISPHAICSLSSAADQFLASFFFGRSSATADVPWVFSGASSPFFTQRRRPWTANTCWVICKFPCWILLLLRFLPYYRQPPGCYLCMRQAGRIYI